MRNLKGKMVAIAGTALLLASCGSTTKVVDVMYYLYTDNYISSVRSSLDSELGKIANVDFTNHDANNVMSTQTEQVNTALSQGTDVLVVNFVDTAAEGAQLDMANAAKAKDTPIIFFNREVTDEAVNAYDKAVFVGTKAEEAGYMQGQMIADYLVAHPETDLNGDGHISYLMIRADKANKEAIYRTQYSVEKGNEYLAAASSTLTLVPSILNTTQNDSSETVAALKTYTYNADWSQAGSYTACQTAIQSATSLTNGDIELVIANNDDSALGAITRLAELGHNTGVTTDPIIPVFGVDATQAAKDKIASKQMTGTVKQDAVAMAKCIAHLVENVVTGKGLITTADRTTYNFDTAAAKIRIPYAPYLGE